MKKWKNVIDASFFFFVDACCFFEWWWLWRRRHDDVINQMVFFFRRHNVSTPPWAFEIFGWLKKVMDILWLLVNLSVKYNNKNQQETTTISFSIIVQHLLNTDYPNIAASSPWKNHPTPISTTNRLNVRCMKMLYYWCIGWQIRKVGGMGFAFGISYFKTSFYQGTEAGFRRCSWLWM